MNARAWQHCFPMYCKVNMFQKKFLHARLHSWCTLTLNNFLHAFHFIARTYFYFFCILMAAQCADGAGGWVF